MARSIIQARINAPARDVWDCYAGTRAEELAVNTFAQSLSIEGEGNGSTRITTLKDGSVIRERLDFIDHDAFICEYSILDRGFYPYTDYNGRLSVTADGENACIVNLVATFTPVTMSDDEAVALHKAHNLEGIENIKQMVVR